MKSTGITWALLFCSLLMVEVMLAQDTFSIVAIDPLNGQVGSAGATCLDSVMEGTSAVIISVILPGKGVIHTQSFWNPVNQANATLRMQMGDSPEEIISWLQANDADGNPAIRQYGIADLDESDQVRVAAFTGASCFDWKGHQFGPNYAIQGNILSGESILDSMAMRFFFEPGDLAQKLMASLQGAKKIGADTRCNAHGVSSRSAFLRVANPSDSNTLYCDLVVGSTPSGVDPIDVLQDKFDVWREANPYVPPVSGISIADSRSVRVLVHPNPTTGESRLRLQRSEDPLPANLVLSFSDLRGQLIHRMDWDGKDMLLSGLRLPPGPVFIELSSAQGFITRSRILVQN